MGNDPLSFLTNTGSCSILVELLGEPSYASELDRSLDSNYPHIHGSLQKFEEYGLVSGEKDGKKKMYELTDTGRDAAELLDKLSSVLSGGENPQ